MTILIADDSQFMRTILKEIIQGIYPDVIIVEAADGNEAIAQYNTHKPDLLLLDIVMPEKTGIEVLQEIGKNQGKKIVIVSSIGQEETVQQLTELGADAFVTKPFEEDLLKKTLADILSV